MSPEDQKLALKLLWEVIVNGSIRWDFDEQQADPINRNWHDLARKLIDRNAEIRLK